MAITVFSLYPKSENSTFDRKYYVENHLPLILEAWKPYGLLDVKLVGVSGNIDGTAAPFAVHATMTWKSLEGFQNAFGDPKTADILADVPHYTNTTPTIFWGEDIGSA